MKSPKTYAFVFRYHNYGAFASHEVRIISVRHAREYYEHLLTQYDIVFMFKQFN